MLKHFRLYTKVNLFTCKNKILSLFFLGFLLFYLAFEEAQFPWYPSDSYHVSFCFTGITDANYFSVSWNLAGCSFYVSLKNTFHRTHLTKYDKTMTVCCDCHF